MLPMTHVDTPTVLLVHLEMLPVTHVAGKPLHTLDGYGTALPWAC